MIRKYPAGNQEKDHRIAPRRDTNPTFGEFGAIVYVYRLSLEPVKSRSNKYVPGKLYHPVDTPQEASFWLAYYQERTEVKRGDYNAKPEYVEAYFVPRGEV